MIFHEGDRIQLTSNQTGHTSWNGRYGVVVKYNDDNGAMAGSYDCEMENQYGEPQDGLVVHWFPREMTLIESFESQVVKKLGEDYL